MDKPKLYQRGVAGFPIGADHVMKSAYGKIPDCNRFQNQAYGFEEALAVHGWQWSTTFQRWSALVTMPDGWTGYSFPEESTSPLSPEEAMELIQVEIRASNNGKLLLANLPKSARGQLKHLIAAGSLVKTTFMAYGDAIRLGGAA